jgi:predicted DNA-binding transcriptional regulator AlpA
MQKKLIPDPQVIERYSISSMTLWRWDHDFDLKFPKPIIIRGRKYRDQAELDAFDEAQRQPGARTETPSGQRRDEPMEAA